MSDRSSPIPFRRSNAPSPEEVGPHPFRRSTAPSLKEVSSILLRRSNLPSPEEVGSHHVVSFPSRCPLAITADLPQRFVRSNAPSPEQRSPDPVLLSRFQDPRFNSARCRDSLRARVRDRVPSPPSSAVEQRDIPHTEGRDRLAIRERLNRFSDLHEAGTEGQRGRSLSPRPLECTQIQETKAVTISDPSNVLGKLLVFNTSIVPTDVSRNCCYLRTH
jgi:hypothetical protein